MGTAAARRPLTRFPRRPGSRACAGAAADATTQGSDRENDEQPHPDEHEQPEPPHRARAVSIAQHGLPVPSWTLHRSCAGAGVRGYLSTLRKGHARVDVRPSAVAAGRPRAKPQHRRAPSTTPPPGGASDPPGRTGQHGDRCGSHQPGHRARPSTTDTHRADTCPLQDAGRVNTFHRPCQHCCPPHCLRWYLLPPHQPALG